MRSSQQQISSRNRSEMIVSVINPKSLLLELCYHKQPITLIKWFYYKSQWYLDFENDMAVLKYFIFQYFQDKFPKSGW